MLHASDVRHLKQLALTLPHALLVHGADGIDIRPAVEILANKNGTIEWLTSGESTIPVTAIRDLYQRTATKAATRRLIVIENAELMTTQAQNAFLKLLEEPNESIHFILLSSAPHELLPTVRSRTQQIMIRPLTRQQSEVLLDTLKVTDTKKRAQLLFLAVGQSAELTRLATDETYFQTRSTLIKDARAVLQGSKYEALRIVYRYKDDRTKALLLIDSVIKLVENTVKRDGNEAHLSQLKKYMDVYEVIRQNGNLRLQLTAAVI